MAKNGRGYQVQDERYQHMIEKSDKTFESQIKCPYCRNYLCTKKELPISEYVSKVNDKPLKGKNAQKSRKKCFPHKCSYFQEYKKQRVREYTKERHHKN